MKDHGPSCAAGAHRQRPRHAVSLAALEGAARLLRALADAPRLQILEMLTGGELCVTEIVAAAKEKFSTISQRLRTLRIEGIVTRRREGTHIFYALADRHVADLILNAREHAQELADRPLRPARADDAAT